MLAPADLGRHATSQLDAAAFASMDKLLYV